MLKEKEPPCVSPIAIPASTGACLLLAHMYIVEDIIEVLRTPLYEPLYKNNSLSGRLDPRVLGPVTAAIGHILIGVVSDDVQPNYYLDLHIRTLNAVIQITYLKKSFCCVYEYFFEMLYVLLFHEFIGVYSA